MRSPLRVPPLPPPALGAWNSTTAYLGDLITPTVRLGVTGLARSGKTVFITALVRNLVSGGRLPFFPPQAEGRLVSAFLEPQPDDDVPRFDYEDNLEVLGRDPPEWPDSTRRISELRIVLAFKSQNPLRRMLGISRLNVDIVDYPGEWLTDLALLNQTYAQWSASALRFLRDKRRADASATFLAYLDQLNPAAADSEAVAREGADIFTRVLAAVRAGGQEVSIQGPGRFLMPGDLAGSPLLTFFPVAPPGEASAQRGALHAMLARRFESYKSMVVRPFFRDHFKRLDRQIVLVDALAALNAGPGALLDFETALAGVLTVFRPGANSWLSALTGRRVDRLLFAATKADHLHHTSHDRLEALLRAVTDRAIARATGAGADVRVMALAALRATREVEVRQGKELLGCIAGVPLKGESIDGEVFDGRREVAIFPGDLPEDPEMLLHGKAGAPPPVRFVRFRPLRVPPAGADGELPPVPHIRLDRALDFLLGDWLA